MLSRRFLEQIFFRSIVGRACFCRVNLDKNSLKTIHDIDGRGKVKVDDGKI
jgi:hypothetical protein